MSERDTVELAVYWRILRKRKWMVIVPTILVLASAFVVLRYMTPIYVSSATLMILDRDVVEDVATEVSGERVHRGQVARDYERTRLQELNQEVQGQTFLKVVGRRLGLDQKPAVLAAARRRQARLPHMSLDGLIELTYTQHLKNKISVEKGGLNLFRFVCENTNPQAAYEFALAAAEYYEQEYAIRQRVEVTERAEVFTVEALGEHRKLLAEAQRKLQAMRGRMTRRDLSQSNPVTAENYAETRRLVEEADFEVTTINNRIQRAMEKLSAALGTPAELERQVSSARLARLSGDLEQAERDQVSLLVQGGGGMVGADVNRVRQDIFSEMSAQVADRFPEESLQNQKRIGDIVFDHIVVRSVQARRREIQQLLTNYSNRVVQQPKDELEIENQEAEVARLSKLVGNMEAKLVNDRVKSEAQEASAEARVSIVDHPQVPDEPDRPNKVRILLLALLAGPLLGIGAVVLSEYLDTSMRTVEEVEEVLEVPVLGTIPKLVPSNTRSPSQRARKRRQRAGAAGVVLLLSALAVAAASGPAGAAPGGAGVHGAAAGTTSGEIHG